MLLVNSPRVQYYNLVRWVFSSWLVSSGFSASNKEVLQTNAAQKERIGLEKSVSEWLSSQKEILAMILTGQLTLNDATAIYVDQLQDASALAANLQVISGAMGGLVVPQVKFAGTHLAGGFIPDLEIAAARKGGYNAGEVVSKTISNGGHSFGAIANSAESITRIKVGSKAYDYVNPPYSSIAGQKHLRESIRRTGINPYALPQSDLKASGYVPTGFESSLPLAGGAGGLYGNSQC